MGSGISSPYFGTLGKIEEWLTELEENTTIDKELNDFIRASLYGSYYQVAMKDNVDIYNTNFNRDKPASSIPISKRIKLLNTYRAYRDFLRILNQILYNRRSNTVSKQVNLFTTNIDIFFEKVIEDLDLCYNDGFNGIFRRRFSLRNFKKSFFQKSLHYDNIAEIPVYNLLKIHGSITWELIDSELQFTGLSLIESLNELKDDSELLDIVALDNSTWTTKKRNATIDEIIENAESYCSIMGRIPNISDFVEGYEKLQIVNPTKEKFKDTTLNKTYYETLRLYANELEKENSVLFIMGFSMADEHIREITIRAAKSNPTLKIFICSYTKMASDIIANLKSDNVNLINFHNIELINPFDGFTLSKFNELILTPLFDNIKSY
ncbi:MAG: SIR2 family protein [Candidatus Azobacteroides sp.]|nr:SIR2 family protein [Candidatus Azobacteroides sp.]